MTLLGATLPDAGAVLDRLTGVEPGFVIAALAMHLLNHVLRSVAWRNVLAAAYRDQPMPLLRIVSAYAAGVALNAVAPARGGDVAKIALVRTATPGSNVATIASTMSVLVVFDLVAATVLVLIVGLSGAVPLDLSSPFAGGVPGWLVAYPLLTVAGAVATAFVARLAWRALRTRLRVLGARIREGGAILRTPGRYAHRVVLPQIGAWCCRVGVVFCLLAAFGLPASVALAVVVMVLTGASTIVPLTPGGMGTQQVVLAFALSQTASAAAVVSFSLGMQAGVTAVNALLGVAAAMAIARTHRPLAALRAARLRVAAAPAD